MRPGDGRGNTSAGTEETALHEQGNANDSTISPAEKMRRAKICMSHAAALALANAPDAELVADDALKQLREAREALARVGAGD